MAHKTSLISPLVLKCLYRAMKVYGHVYVRLEYQFYVYVSLVEFGNAPTVWYFVFILSHKNSILSPRHRLESNSQIKH